jgi:catalase (peroxidase I)
LLTDKFSAADALSLGGAVTVRHCGGPSIDWAPGRIDVTSLASATSPDGLLPDAADSFAVSIAKMRRMGLTDIQIVALSTGSHSMGFNQVTIVVFIGLILLTYLLGALTM